MKNIKRLFNVIDNSLFTINGKLGYDRLTDAFILLANLVHAYEYPEDEECDLWYIGEHSFCSLDNLIVGAYWHYTEWHGGQSSKGYQALSVLGTVFNPGCTDPEEDNDAYQMLETMAKDYHADTVVKY